MARTDIWRDGINSQFSRENQPLNRGRKKGRPNRATIYRAALAVLATIERATVQQRRDHRNALRRERYRAKKRVGGTTHPTLMSRRNHPTDSDQTK